MFQIPDLSLSSSFSSSSSSLSSSSSFSSSFTSSNFTFFSFFCSFFFSLFLFYPLKRLEERSEVTQYQLPPRADVCQQKAYQPLNFFFFHLTGTGINCSKSQAFNWIFCVISDSDTFTTYVACPWFEFAFVNCSNNSGLFFLLESDLICLDPTRFPAVPEAEAQNKPSPTASGYFLSSTLLFQRASTVLCHTLLVCTQFSTLELKSHAHLPGLICSFLLLSEQSTEPNSRLEATLHSLCWQCERK